ncbi:hypothetical protein KP509_14G021600 [Ceratopteris richardii]|uniref:At3g05675-like ankyrin-like domain-containing protein n=1 Tax=Ceratopteris richardii TaxID=49495 RepID=A0A8T2TAT5_CERRI|nr:hypothetical protein KP509_14G021600 [Ceratopteris richardii]KAH7414975.1 hypothetical protein KP509_14G021600 [Ceratopteris richardii]
MPWAEEDELKVTSLLSELQLEGKKVGEVLQRVSTDGKTGVDNVLMNLIQMITVGTCEKARHEMKSLMCRMLRENATQGCNADGLIKECLYEHCHSCVDKLVELFTMASTGAVIPNNTADDYRGILSSQIMRQADNLSWLLDIMIDRQVCDEFLQLWAFQTKLASLHPQVPLVLGRYEISRIMAGLCVALGKGQVLAPKEVRYELLHNWLQPLIDDFAWMRRACKGLDMATIQEGICQTISTLPLDQQQTMIIIWFERFVQNGDDCPKLQRAFELCWRRIFFGSISSNTC